MAGEARRPDWRWRIAASVAAAAAALGACSEPEPPPAPARDVSNIGYRVKVLAGDILVVDGVHVRLSNAFAPEGVPRARCWAEAVASRQVAAVVEDMVRGSHSISVRPTGGRDEYNRVYAVVDLDGIDLGQTLYERALAAQPPKGRFEWCAPLSVAGPGAPTVLSILRP